jgi:methyl-accepting chemotaxis protein
MKLTIRNKLIAGYSALLVLMAAVAGIGAYSLVALKRDAHDATTIGGRLNSIAIEIQVHNLEAQRRVKSYLSEVGKLGPEKARSLYLEEADFEIHEIESLSAKAVVIAPDTEKRAKFAKIVDSLAVYKNALAEAVKDAESGAQASERSASVTKYEAAADTLHDDAEDGEVAGRDASEESEADIARTSKRAQSLSLGISLAGLLIGIGMSIVLLRAILRPVDHLREVAESVSMGNLQISVKRYSDDEIGDLSDSFSRMLTAVKYFRMEAELVQEEALQAKGEKD